MCLFMQIMLETAKRPNVKDCCEIQGCLSKLQELCYGLDRCQKSLNSYADIKRNAFPRFFFLSNDELLPMLGHSDPSCVQEHMVKVGVTWYSRGKCWNILSLVKLYSESVCLVLLQQV